MTKLKGCGQMMKDEPLKLQTRRLAIGRSQQLVV